MKELSIEEKAKAYDEAIKKAKNTIEVNRNIPDIVECVESLFPELKEESEDEKIRKEIIDYIDSEYRHTLGLDRKNRFIAWLEKQGEHANFRNKIQIGDKVTRNEDGVLVNLSQLKRVAKKDEKQSKQKPTYTKEYDFHGIKFIPKFAKGDIIKDKKRDEVTTIEDFSYDTGLYTHTYGQFPITIQDNYEIIEQKTADKSDVLMSLDEAIAHCKEKSCGDNACALEHKQLEKWLTELKKLKEQKSVDKVEPKFKVGDKIKLAREPKYPAREIIAIQDDAYYFDEVVYLPFGRQDEWELVEQQPTWSKEDRQTLHLIIDGVWPTKYDK